MDQGRTCHPRICKRYVVTLDYMDTKEIISNVPI